MFPQGPGRKNTSLCSLFLQNTSSRQSEIEPSSLNLQYALPKFLSCPICSPPTRLRNESFRLFLRRYYNDPLFGSSKYYLEKPHLRFDIHLLQHRLLSLPILADPRPNLSNPLLSRRGSYNPKWLPKLLLDRPLRQPNADRETSHNQRARQRGHLRQPRRRTSDSTGPLHRQLSQQLDSKLFSARELFLPAERDVHSRAAGTGREPTGRAARARGAARSVGEIHPRA